MDTPTNEGENKAATRKDRNPDGTFAKRNSAPGASAGGRAKARKLTLAKMAQDHHVRRVFSALMEAVDKGEGWAIKLFAEYTEGKPVEKVEVTSRPAQTLFELWEAAEKAELDGFDPPAPTE
jgi:hypothetical protein